MTGSDDFDIARREVLLRRIGHEQLLQSGDSTSRVLLIKKIDENEYQIRFENDLTFQPDSPLWQHAALGKSAKAYSYLFKTVPRALCFGNQIAMKYYALVKINAVG